MGLAKFAPLERIVLLFVALLYLAIAMVMPGVAVGAQNEGIQTQGNGLQISPAVRDFTLDPGETVSYEVRLTNITGLPISARGILTDFEQKAGEAGIPQLIVDDKESQYSLKGFIPDLGTVSLQPRELKVLTVPITVPKNASPGAHFGAIRFTADDSQKPGETVVTLAAGVGVLVFINVTGEAKDSLSLVQIAAAKDGKQGSLFNSGPVDVVTRLRNDGTTYLKPFGRIVVRDWKNRTIEEKDYNAENKKIIIPETTRRLEDKLNPSTKYLGRYTVEVQLSYGTGGGNIIIAKTAFWVLPWKQLLIGLAAFVIVIFGITTGLRSYKHRILKQARRGR